MTVTASRPLVFSMLLHGAAVGALVFLMLRTSREPAVVPQPFEIFPAPSETASQVIPQTTSTVVAVKLPALPVPVPRAESSVEENVADEPVRSAPVPRTTQAVAPTSSRTSSEQSRSKPSSAAKPVVAPVSAARTSHARINMDEVLGTSASESAKPPVASDPAAEAAYWNRLQAKLRDAHQKPDGLDDGLQVRVEFVLRADGTLGDVRVVSSSGNAEFDASVVAAFRRVRGLGAPPASKAGLNQVTFRIRAD